MANVSVDRFELGYCGECGTATVVARLQLRHWRHAVAICARCLRAYAAAIDLEVVNAARGPYGQHDHPSA